MAKIVRTIRLCFVYTVQLTTCSTLGVHDNHPPLARYEWCKLHAWYIALLAALSLVQKLTLSTILSILMFSILQATESRGVACE